MDSSVSILYEDDFLIVVNKPSLLHSVDVTKRSGNSVASFLTEHKSHQDQVSTKMGEGGLVHRLDFETSGILVAAKDRATWEDLRLSISSSESKKTYLLAAPGKFPKECVVNSQISSRSRYGKKVIVTENTPRGARWSLESKTSFQLIDYNEAHDFSLVRASLSRGRRHQVRAHAAYIGFPLVGDVLYGSKESLITFLSGSGETAAPETSPPFFLHAESISFLHPHEKRRVQFVAPVPTIPWVTSFQALLQ